MKENKNNERLSAKEQQVVALTDSEKDFFNEDKEKYAEQLSTLESQIVQLVGKGKDFKFSEPAVINVDDFVAKDVLEGVSVKDDGTIELQGCRIDEAGARASFTLEGRDEYALSDLDKVLDAVKWDLPERNKKHASLDDVLHCAEQCGLSYLPVGLKGDIHVNNFDNGSGCVDFDLSYATIGDNDVVVHESLSDVFDYGTKSHPLSELPDDVQKKVLDRLFDNFQAEDDPMVVVYDVDEVPSYALNAIINGDFSGIENPEDEKDIRDFINVRAGWIFDVQPNSNGFSKTPAFGEPTVCETVFCVKPNTPKELKEAFCARLEKDAKRVIYDRITNPRQRAFTSGQIFALNRYHQIVTPDTPAKEVFSRLLHEVSQTQAVSKVPEKWLSDTAKELDDLAEGKVRDESQQLKR